MSSKTSELKAIRKNNALMLLQTNCNGVIQDFADKIGRSHSQVSAFIKPDAPVGIGNKMARVIEQGFNLPTGWLDEERDMPRIEKGNISEIKEANLDTYFESVKSAFHKNTQRRPNVRSKFNKDWNFVVSDDDKKLNYIVEYKSKNFNNSTSDNLIKAKHYLTLLSEQAARTLTNNNAITLYELIEMFKELNDILRPVHHRTMTHFSDIIENSLKDYYEFYIDEELEIEVKFNQAVRPNYVSRQKQQAEAEKRPYRMVQLITRNNIFPYRGADIWAAVPTPEQDKLALVKFHENRENNAMHYRLNMADFYWKEDKVYYGAYEENYEYFTL